MRYLKCLCLSNLSFSYEEFMISFFFLEKMQLYIYRNAFHSLKEPKNYNSSLQISTFQTLNVQAFQI